MYDNEKIKNYSRKKGILKKTENIEYGELVVLGKLITYFGRRCWYAFLKGSWFRKILIIIKIL